MSLTAGTNETDNQPPVGNCGGWVVPCAPFTESSAAYSAWSHCSCVLHSLLVMRLPVFAIDRQIFFGLRGLGCAWLGLSFETTTAVGEDAASMAERIVVIMGGISFGCTHLTNGRGQAKQRFLYPASFRKCCKNTAQSSDLERVPRWLREEIS